MEEIEGSRLLLHVVDASNPRWQQQIASVDRILSELKFDQIPRLLVFNKVDLIDKADLDARVRSVSIESGQAPVAISATNKKTLTLLLDRIDEALPRELAQPTFQ